MNEKELQKVFKKKNKLFDMIFSVQESREIQDLMFDSSPISELSQLVINDKEESDQVENDIQRLESLQTVHEESAQVFNKIQALKDSQSHIIYNLKDDKRALEAIKESFKENIGIIKENMQIIKDRLAKLKN